jgi:hypothetical protein
MQIKSSSKMAEDMQGYDTKSTYFFGRHLVALAFFGQSTFTFWNIYRKCIRAAFAGANKNSLL